MDVSAETADLVVRESIQAAESAAKLAGEGVKNVAALLLAIAKQDYKVVGETSSKRLARDPTSAVVISLKKEDMGRFKKCAREYGVLYFFAQKRGNESGVINVVCNQNYVAQLNAVMEAMGYPIPQKEREDEMPKKAVTRAPRERSSPERGIGSTPSRTKAADIEQKPSVKKRLEGLRAVSEQMREGQEKIRSKTK